MDTNKEAAIIEEQKSALTKTLAIVGFFTLIILMVWLAVKIVSIVPSAFSSLASIADSVYNHNRDESLSVTTEKSVANAGEAFTISWEELRADGTYTFSYQCAEGVAVEVRDASGGIEALACDTELDVTGMTELAIRVASEKNRFTDIKYMLRFTPKDERRAIVTAESMTTIVNATIPALSEETPDETPSGEVVGEPTPAPTTPRPTTPSYTYVETVTYSTPVSNPNGNIDLQVIHKAVGTMEGSRFTPASRLEVDEKGAIQFEVKNVGTKTSDSWSYEAKLPSGITYKSGTQKALKPQERAVITLAFEGFEETGNERFGVEVDATGDSNSKNDAYTWVVNVVR